MKVLIVVDAKYDIENVRLACTRLGLEQPLMLPNLHMLSGVVESERIPALSGTTGVLSIETQRDFQIPPPDSEVQ